MAREGITAAQVAQAADALVGEGKQPTIRGVRDRLGGGSPNTVHRHLTAWRETRPPAVAAAPELPASLTASIAAEIERATAKARAEIEGYLVQAQTEAADLAQAGEVLEAEREALTEQVAALTRERDILAGKAAQQAADLDAQAQRIEREQSAAESARVELATARLRIEGDAERRAEQTSGDPAPTRRAGGREQGPRGWRTVGRRAGRQAGGPARSGRGTPRGSRPP